MTSYPYQYVDNYSTPTTPHSPWETDHQNQAEMFNIPQPQAAQAQVQTPPAFSPNQTIHLPEPERIVPSQHHQLQDVLEHQEFQLHPHQQHHPTVGRNSESISPSSSGSLAVRRPPTTRQNVQHATHPYRRPSSAAGTLSRTTRVRDHTRSARSGGDEHASLPHHQNVRFVGPGQSTSVTVPGSAPANRVTGLGSNDGANVAASSTNATTTGTGVPQFAPQALVSVPGVRRMTMRADVHYDSENNTVIAMLELPGLKSTDLKIRLSTTPYNRVRQLSVSGRSKPVFAENLVAVRERKFGEFSRTFPVPPDTQPEDIEAELHDGILSIKIQCGAPAASEDAHEIAIR